MDNIKQAQYLTKKAHEIKNNKSYFSFEKINLEECAYLLEKSAKLYEKENECMHLSISSIFNYITLCKIKSRKIRKFIKRIWRKFRKCKLLLFSIESI